MKHTDKMVLVPYQEGEGNVFEDEPRRRPSIRQYAADRQRKLMTIVLRLASYGGYDEDGRMTDRHGREVDIVPLLLHALSPGRDVTGLEDFVDLLVQAGVSPDLIINANVKQMLIDRATSQHTRPKERDYLSRRPVTPPQTPTPQPNPSPPPPPPPPPPPLTQMVFPDERLPATKRKRSEDDEPAKIQKTVDWEKDDSDLDDD